MKGVVFLMGEKMYNTGMIIEEKNDDRKI